MFAKLKNVRDIFARIRAMLTAVPVSAVDAETARQLLTHITALDAAIEELDDAMVAWCRAETFARSANEANPIELFMPASFDIEGFSADLLASAPTFHMGVVS